MNHRRPQPPLPKPTRFCARSAPGLLLTLALLVGPTSGCFYLQYLDGRLPSSQDDTTADAGDSPATGLPTVRLSASNVTPIAGETVQLTCGVIAGNTEGVYFEFLPDLERLTVDEEAGTATFIIDDTDIATTFEFTCRAVTDTETGTASAAVLIVPQATTTDDDTEP